MRNFFWSLYLGNNMFVIVWMIFYEALRVPIYSLKFSFTTTH